MRVAAGDGVGLEVAVLGAGLRRAELVSAQATRMQTTIKMLTQLPAVCRLIKFNLFITKLLTRLV